MIGGANSVLRNPLMRPVAASAILGLLAIGWSIWGNWHAAAITKAIGPAQGKGHFAVTLDFAPEGFHVTRLQAIGRVIEVKGPTVYMMDVDKAAMRSFATAYWVREVSPWQGR